MQQRPHPSIPPSSPPPKPPSLLLFSGGTAMNSIAPLLGRIADRITHVLPVSDDGGSTAEIVRVLGGPAVGDVRARCIRLADESDAESRAVKRLLAHRLPSNSSESARTEYYEIIEGRHELWRDISDGYKHTIRAFLIHFHSNILRTCSNQLFDYSNGSVGNFFFAGARLFFKSLEAAVFLFSRVARIPEGSLVVPCILTEERITLGAELADGTVIRGQNNISHPTLVSRGDKSGNADAPLTSRIQRIFYLSVDGEHVEHQVFPPANPKLLDQLQCTDAIVYGAGSLYTSIAPSLALRGVGETISQRQGIPKILLLNGSHDRETQYLKNGQLNKMRATEIVTSLSLLLNQDALHHHPPCSFFSAILYPVNTEIEIDIDALRELGMESIVAVPSLLESNRVIYQPEALVQAIQDQLL